MPDIDSVIEALEYCVNAYPLCGEKCPFIHRCQGNGRQIQRDALELLKEQDAHYMNLVVAWLREIAINNYSDKTEMTFVDAVEEIKDRAEYGLMNYFRDVRSGKNGS